MPLLQPGSRSAKWQARNARAVVAGVEEAVETVNGAVTAIETAVETAQGAAADAMTSADEAKSQVGLVFTFQQVRDSYSDANVLTANASGGTATISVAAHDRHYLNSTVAIHLNAGNIPGLTPETTYQIFYDDPDFDGGAVAYQASATIEGSLASLEHPARHNVGQVTTPASGNQGSGLPYWKRELLQNESEL